MQTQTQVESNFELSALYKLQLCRSENMNALLDFLSNEASGFRWRTRATVYQPEALRAAVWENVLSQFILTSQSENDLLGLLTSYNTSLRDCMTYVQFVSRGETNAKTLMHHASLTFLTRLFRNWPFRNIYRELPLHEYESEQSAEGRLFTIVGRLPSSFFYLDDFEDIVICSYTRSSVANYLESLQQSIQSNVSEASTLGIDEFCAWIESIVLRPVVPSDSLFEIRNDDLTSWILNIRIIELTKTLSGRIPECDSIHNLYLWYLEQASAPPVRGRRLEIPLPMGIQI